jgi:hypothetical protein
VLMKHLCPSARQIPKVSYAQAKGTQLFQPYSTCPENVTNYMQSGLAIYKKRMLYKLDQQNVFLKWHLGVCVIEKETDIRHSGWTWDGIEMCKSLYIFLNSAYYIGHFILSGIISLNFWGFHPKYSNISPDCTQTSKFLESKSPLAKG